MCPLPKLTVRWTIGDVHRRGFQALRLSLLGAGQIFGNSAAYTVCVNSIAADEAASRVGPLPQRVDWCAVSRDDLPGFIGRQLGEGMAEGVAWKFAPVRLDQTTHELALDNDCILWALPDALRQWLTSDRSVVMAEVMLLLDVEPLLRTQSQRRRSLQALSGLLAVAYRAKCQSAKRETWPSG